MKMILGQDEKVFICGALRGSYFNGFCQSHFRQSTSEQDSNGNSYIWD